MDISWYLFKRFLPTQTTPVKQPAGGLCQAAQSCVEVHACVGFPGRRNVPSSLFLKQSMLLLATQWKSCCS